MYIVNHCVDQAILNKAVGKFHESPAANTGRAVLSLATRGCVAWASKYDVRFYLSYWSHRTLSQMPLAYKSWMEKSMAQSRQTSRFSLRMSRTAPENFSIYCFGPRLWANNVCVHEIIFVDVLLELDESCFGPSMIKGVTTSTILQYKRKIKETLRASTLIQV